MGIRVPSPFCVLLLLPHCFHSRRFLCRPVSANAAVTGHGAAAVLISRIRLQVFDKNPTDGTAHFMVFTLCRAASRTLQSPKAAPLHAADVVAASSSPSLGAAPPHHRCLWEQRHLTPSMLTPPSPEASPLHSIDVVVAWSTTTSLSPDHSKRCKSRIKKSTMEALQNYVGVQHFWVILS
ncbi:uncharacterized protein LOC124682588 [Lolium rigidum]|uniref:uncharacterized protein LOC124682588 n=1 Tax=Lolium rigidum TaxID=89674 RepID=UPI001F5E2BAA|nr:uncharacterized protein LOC124682588 [Lolium rigidum]